MASPASSPGSPERLYNLENVFHRRSRKFNVDETVYSLTMAPFPAGLTYGAIVERLHRLFDELLRELLFDENGEPRYPETDRVRLSISSPDLSHSIWIPFIPPSEMTVDRVLESVERVLQSAREWLLGDALVVEFVHAPLPNGGGRDRQGILLRMGRDLANRKCLIRVTEDDSNLCCARALVLCIAHAEGERLERLLRSLSRQRQRAIDLMVNAGIPLGTVCGATEWKAFQRVLGPRYGLIVLSMEHMNMAVYNGMPEAPKKLVLWHTKGHYHGVKSLAGFYGKRAVCPACLAFIHNRANHRCKHTCFYCSTVGGACVWMDGGLSCDRCGITYPNGVCLKRHLPICRQRRRCVNCEAIYDTRNKHRCHHRLCTACKEYVHREHVCFVKPLERPKKPDGRSTFVFYDFESMEVGGGYHRPNLCVANVTCTLCMDVPIDNVGACECGRRQIRFRGDNALEDFCEHLLGSGLYTGATCLAHNASRYDTHFILQYAARLGTPPEVVSNGLKLMSLSVCGVKFIDSYNFLPMALAALPKAFGLSELRKGYFPHRFNTPENQGYVGVYPDVRHYAPEHMTERVRAEFEAWHRGKVGDVFDLQAELEAYCDSDVDILQRACGVFRKLFREYSGLEPFRGSLTISSACNRVYRTNFLRPKEVALIPARGIWRGNQSSIALCWLTHESERLGVPIRHGGTEGEVRVLGRMVDGLYDGTVWNFLGCFWHGCPRCYTQRDLRNAVNGRTMMSLYNETLRFEAALRDAGYSVTTKWECDFQRDLREDAALRGLRERWRHVDPLQPCDAFYGGRTNALRLHHVVTDPAECIRYYDFCSLYPYINKYGRYACGVPEKLRGSFIPRRVEGLLKCLVLPPRDLYIPVLPYRSRSGKLTFPLCRSCVEDGLTPPCLHEDEAERALMGTWTTAELDKAVELGYRILDKYEAWHYDRVRQYDPSTRSGGVWSEFIDSWMRLKIEASGYPRDVGDDVDARAAYIRRVYEREGVKLDPLKIERNEGLRTLAKLILNRCVLFFLCIHCYRLERECIILFVFSPFQPLGEKQSALKPTPRNLRRRPRDVRQNDDR